MPEPKRDIHESWQPVLERHRELPPHELSRPEHKETLKQAVREHVEQARQSIAAAPTSQTPPLQQGVHPKEEDLRAMDAERQKAFLAHMAVEEGIEPAVKLAEKLDSPFVLDSLHDFIADKLLESLLRQSRFL